MKVRSWCIGLALILSAKTLADSSTSPFVDFTFEDVAALVQNHHPADVTDLLPLLPEGFRTGYTLVYQSQSIQPATLSHPRALLFGRTGKMILAFNGDPSLPGYNRAEILQFRDETQEFELRTITFNAGSAVVSEKNPTQCLACHGAQPHPLWQTYPTWAGVFGSNHDDPGRVTAEQQGWSDFTANAPADPRYKSLVRRTDLSANWPYRPLDAPEHVYRPNTRLGRLLGGMQAQNGARQILSSSFYRSHPASVLFHFLRCDSTGSESYLAKIAALFQSRFPKTQYPKLYASLGAILMPHDQATFELEKLILDSDQSTWDLQRVDESTGSRFAPDSYPGDDIDDLVAARIYGAVESSDPALQPFYERWTVLQNYDFVNGAGSTTQNLAPYGVQDDYDAVNVYINRARASGACPTLAARIDQELR